jgi:hypothetical protein
MPASRPRTAVECLSSERSDTYRNLCSIAIVKHRETRHVLDGLAITGLIRVDPCESMTTVRPASRLSQAYSTTRAPSSQIPRCGSEAYASIHRFGGRRDCAIRTPIRHKS